MITMMVDFVNKTTLRTYTVDTSTYLATTYQATDVRDKSTWKQVDTNVPSTEARDWIMNA